MTTADQLALVTRLLGPGEEATTLAQAGLVTDWVKSKRLLVIVRCGREQALLLLTSQQYPPARVEDLAIHTAVPMDTGLQFDLDPGQTSGPDAVYITVTSNGGSKFLFEMLPGYHTQNFVSEMYRVTESAGRVEAGPGWGWVSKYTQATPGTVVIITRAGQASPGGAALLLVSLISLAI